jgi:hypothetical protein
MTLLERVMKFCVTRKIEAHTLDAKDLVIIKQFNDHFEGDFYETLIHDVTTTH